MVKNPVKDKEPIVWACLDWSYRETGMEDFGLHPAVGFLYFMNPDESKNSIRKLILKEEFLVYWRHVANEYIDFLLNEVKVKHSATITTEFEMSLSKSMGSIPYFGDPTTTEGGKLHEEYKHELNGKFSRSLIALRNSTPDMFIYKVCFGELSDDRMTIEDEKILSGVMFENEFTISKVFMSEVLKEVKNGIMNRTLVRLEYYKERADFIDKFLLYWGRFLLTPQYVQSLDNLGTFLQGDFEDFLSAERKVMNFTDAKKQVLAEVLNEQKLTFLK